MDALATGYDYNKLSLRIITARTYSRENAWHRENILNDQNKKKAIQAFNKSRLDDLENLVHPNSVCHRL